MNLNEDFREFIELLNAHEVRYLVVGGYAVSFHGHPRYTKDIDIWIELDAANAERVILALADFGFGELGIETSDFLVDDHIIQLGYPPNRIDIITSLEGVEFDTCYKQRSEASANNTIVNFINCEHLKQNKRATGRPQDLADVDHLEP